MPFRLSARLALCLLAVPLALRAQDNVPVAPPAPNPVPSAPPAALPVAGAATNAPAPAGAGLTVVSAAAARFDGAMLAFNAGRWGEAVADFADFVRDFPADRRREEALFRLAEAYRNLGRADDALAAYTFQVQGYPDGPFRANAELRRGAILLDAGKADDARAALAFASGHADGELKQAASYLLGKALLALKQEPDARALWQDLAGAQPPGKFAAAAAQELAQLEDQENRPAAALAWWQKLAKLGDNPGQIALAYARGGWDALAADQPGAAEPMFQGARKLAPDGPVRALANTGLLRLLFAQKRYKEWLAVDGAEAGAVLPGAKTELLYDRGYAHFALKQWADAVAAFDQYLKENPGGAAAGTVAYERFLAVVQPAPARTLEEADAYLQAWPQSPYRAQVRLLMAQELSREKRYADALPVWESLAGEKGGDDWPRAQIKFELARTYDLLGNWAKAAPAYQDYLNELTAHPDADPAEQTQKIARVQARLAVCLQKTDQLMAATDAWKAVQAEAAAGSPEQQMALESLALIYGKGGPPQHAALVATLRQILDRYPQSPLHALAAFTVGDELFRKQDYAGAVTLLLEARRSDPKAWQQPATQRLVLASFAQKKDAETIAYLKDYDLIPPPDDPQARIAARLPAALFYWLAENARKAANPEAAEYYDNRVVQHPDPGDLLAPATWQLAEAQAQRQEWEPAVANYEKYRQMKPETKDATAVLLALGRARAGLKDYDGAKALAGQALLQEPEGTNSAAARSLLGDVALATGQYAEASRQFVTLSLLFESDADIAPHAMDRAAEAFARAGDAASADEWRKKLRTLYPQYRP